MQEGHRVLDACCAPGGKTTHILECASNLKELVAVDLEPSRMSRVKDNLSRLKLSATLKVADVGALESWWDGVQFDRILLDAPCSATGVIRKHPDIKLLRRESDIHALTTLQLQLLRTLWTALAPGGKLVYATCSILPEENVDVVEHFLQEEASATAQIVPVSCGIAQSTGRQLWPQVDGHDGFYYAVLVKTPQ